MSKYLDNNKDTSKPIAWILSIVIHLSIGILAFFVTWSVIQGDEEPPPKITAVWHEAPLNSTPQLPLTSQSFKMPEIKQSSMPTMPLPKEKSSLRLSQNQGSVRMPELVMEQEETQAEFMGLDAVAAKRVVYVVDASGSMLMHLSSVVKELKHSMQQLHPKQEFGIIFFQQNEAIHVPPKERLQPASGHNISSAIAWIGESGHVIPSGGSNPMVAIKAGLRMKPDVMYLLSENITGSGKYAVSPETILGALNELNPQEATTGRRRVQINCVEYLTRDPQGTMQRIAAIHGGNNGYTHIERGTVGK